MARHKQRTLSKDHSVLCLLVNMLEVFKKKIYFIVSVRLTLGSLRPKERRETFGYVAAEKTR